MPKSSFFSPRRLALLAMLTAASIVLSRLCVIYLTPTLRVEFGNLPIFLAGLFLGPAGRCAGQNAVDDVLAHGAVWHRFFAAAGCAGAAVSWRLAG